MPYQVVALKTCDSKGFIKNAITKALVFIDLTDGLLLPTFQST